MQLEQIFQKCPKIDFLFFFLRQNLVLIIKKQDFTCLGSGSLEAKPLQVLRQLFSRLPDSVASWLQFLGKEGRNGARFQQKFAKDAYCVENSDLEKNNYFIISWKLPSGSSLFRSLRDVHKERSIFPKAINKKQDNLRFYRGKLCEIFNSLSISFIMFVVNVSRLLKFSGQEQ